MTPQISAEAALKWLQYKGWVHDETGKAARDRGDEGASQRYTPTIRSTRRRSRVFSTRRGKPAAGNSIHDSVLACAEGLCLVQNKNIDGLIVARRSRWGG